MLKVATPALEVIVTVLPPLNAPGPLVIPTVTWSVLSVVTTLPNGSSILTVTAGLMATPAFVSVGCWPKTNWLALLELTRMLLDVAVKLPALVLNAMFIVSALS